MVPRGVLAGFELDEPPLKQQLLRHRSWGLKQLRGKCKLSCPQSGRLGGGAEATGLSLALCVAQGTAPQVPVERVGVPWKIGWSEGELGLIACFEYREHSTT